MTRLPEAFKEKMEGLLGTEYAAFLESYEKERVQGLRYNPLKISEGEFLELQPFHLKKIPWVKEGYYYDASDRPGSKPWHEAGLYYIQEPSAMAAAELLDPQPGDFVLDLCGAPGGKTTQIAGRLKGCGFLLSNEIHPARAKVLSQNVERMGIQNAVVTNETPDRLAERFPGFFDKVMVDAPCSGEGMFRKDELAGIHWSPQQVAVCAARQLAVLSCAAAMVKPGGRLVYSTCTFSPEEDEEAAEAFLMEHPDFEAEAPELKGLSPGRPEWTKTKTAAVLAAYRIWPHLAEGEGHFLAAFRKNKDSLIPTVRPFTGYCRDDGVLKAYEQFCLTTFASPQTYLEKQNLLLFGDQLYLYPEGGKGPDGLKILRPGLHLGTMKKDRLEPAHGLALSMKKEEALRWLSMEAEGPEVISYLRGETLPIPPAAGKEAFPAGQKGWVLMTVGGISIGWAKAAGGVLKNHYPKGLRKLTMRQKMKMED